MLSPKKIDKKKLIIYVLIIFVMVGFTSFSIYKNYRLTHGGGDDFLSEEFDPALDIDFIDEEIDVSDGTGSDTENKEVDISKKDIKDFDISILSDPKFINLKDAVISQPYEVNIGKTNPFEPK